MSGLFGSSALAGAAELEEAGLFGKTGVRLGVFSQRNWRGRESRTVLRDTGDHHHLVVAGSGGGKFVSSLGLVLLDFLSQPTGSCVVVDPKGEVLHAIGKMAMRPFKEQEPGDFQVAWLDPWDLSQTGATSSYNFLTPLIRNDKNLADDARALADAIIIDRQSKTSHWDESAKIFLTGILIYVAIHPEEHQRDLTRVSEILMLPWKSDDEGKETLQDVLRSMAEMDDPSTLANGVGDQYLGMPPEERESIFSGARRDCVWIKSLPMRRVLAGSPETELSLKEVATGRYLLFVVLPFERIRTHRAWLRLLVTALADAFRQNVPEDKSFAKRRHVFVDEWPRLKELEVFQDEIAIARGASVQYHLYCQSFGQIEENYPRGWQDFVANSTIQAFAIQDKMTSEYLSTISGARTVENESASTSMDSAWRRSRSRNTSLIGRPVLMPDEIRRLRNEQLILKRGLNPIRVEMEVVYRAEEVKRAKRFTLLDVLLTLGRDPEDENERKHFAWRE